jgi:hypothetical protein
MIARLDERIGDVHGAAGELRGMAAHLQERVEALAQRLQACEEVLARKPQKLGQWLKQRFRLGSH